MLSLLPPARLRAAPSDAPVTSPRRPAVILPWRAGAREQHGRLRAAGRGAAGRPRRAVRRRAGVAPRLAPQRRRARRPQLLAGHPPPAPRPRLVPETSGGSGVRGQGAILSRFISSVAMGEKYLLQIHHLKIDCFFEFESHSVAASLSPLTGSRLWTVFSVAHDIAGRKMCRKPWNKMINVLKVRAFILTLNCSMLADGKLSLIGHSAGGWLARVYMEEFGTSDISLLLTLGTPHLPPPKGVSGVIDQTRGLLNYVEKNCAPAVYTPELRYVCIAGRYIQGAPLSGNSLATTTDELVAVDAPSEVAEAVMVSADNKTAPTGPTFRARFVGQGYKQVCGRADVWGDGVVPEVSAHLEGALNISYDGVYHSPVGSDDEELPWYGSPAILEQWVHHLLS